MTQLQRQLQCFVEVARRGSFAQAASHLKLSPSHISRQVHTLEHWLGCRLILAGVTRQGGVFLPYAERALQENDEMQAIIVDEGKQAVQPLEPKASPAPSPTQYELGRHNIY